MQDEVDDQMKNSTWKPTFEDFTDIITIYYVDENQFNSVLGGGILRWFIKQTPT